jgi:hypothetical protein
MLGETWDRLVQPPSPTEVEAALAEVRVRAIVHARRARRLQRAFATLGFLAAAVGGVFLGRVSGGAAAFPLDWSGSEIDSLSLPLLAEEGDPTRSVPGPIQRFHITSWTEFEGVRMNEGEAYIEGAPGTNFEIRTYFEGSSFRGRFYWVRATDEWVQYGMLAEAEIAHGLSPRGLRLVEHGTVSRSISVRHGQPVVVYAFGRPRRGHPVTRIRIEGPYAPPPAQPVLWRPMRQNAAYYDTPAEIARRFEAEGRLVRYASLRMGGLFVIPGFTPPPVKVRFTLEGHEPSPVVEAPGFGNGPLFTIPGLADTVRVTLARPYPEDAFACVHLQPDLNSPRRDRPNFQVCFPKSDQWVPVFPTVPGVGRLKVELVPPEN